MFHYSARRERRGKISNWIWLEMLRGVIFARCRVQRTQRTCKQGRQRGQGPRHYCIIWLAARCVIAHEMLMHFLNHAHRTVSAKNSHHQKLYVLQEPYNLFTYSLVFILFTELYIYCTVIHSTAFKQRIFYHLNQPLVLKTSMFWRKKIKQGDTSLKYLLVKI